MSEYEELVKLRNRGYTQGDIAKSIECSSRTVIRYLSSGKIPVYSRTKPTKVDPFEKFKERAEQIINAGINDKVPRCSDIYRTLVNEGYQGSLRTVERKTQELRRKRKVGNEIYFEQKVDYGKMIEGDFTDIDVPFIDGVKKRHLWVMSLKRSKGAYASSFSNQTFEAFAEGTVNGFNYFGGIPEIYRLDNLKPAVKKIVKNGRHTTHRFNQLIAHYGFRASFCTPGKGSEKGTVEATNKHFKNYLSYEIKIENKKFVDDEDFEAYLSLKIREYDRAKEGEIEKEKQHLSPLPQTKFSSFTTEIDRVNKYGFVRAAGRRYSVPAKYKYLQVEIRLYSKRIEIFCSGKLIKQHNRQTKSGGQKPTIDFRDHVDSMLRKPGAFTYYKHREAFFPTETFQELYARFPDNKNYLRCLSLCKEYSLSEVELAIKLALSDTDQSPFENIISLIKPVETKYDVSQLKPLNPSLGQYDHLYDGGNKKWMLH